MFKTGGGKGRLNNVKKNCTFGIRRLPFVILKNEKQSMVADFSNLPTHLNQVNEMTFLKVKNIFSKPGGIESHLGPKQAPRPLSIKQKDCFPISSLFPRQFVNFLTHQHIRVSTHIHSPAPTYDSY